MFDEMPPLLVAVCAAIMFAGFGIWHLVVWMLG